MRLKQRLFLLAGVALLPAMLAILAQPWLGLHAGPAWSLVAGFGGIAASLALACFFVERVVLQPVRRLMDAPSSSHPLPGRAETGGLLSEFDEITAAQAASQAALAQALSQNQRVLREANHRVMNSLQTIAAIFRLQAIRLSDPAMRMQFDEAIARIDSIAMAYRRIEASGTGELIAFDALLEDLCGSLAEPRSNAATLTVEADPLHLTPDEALPLTIIVNELVSNALKYREAGETPLVVSLQRGAESNRLALRNRGALPEGFKADEAKGFGMQMVAAMVRQLRGTLEAVTVAGETEFAVTFRSSLPQAPLARHAKPA